MTFEIPTVWFFENLKKNINAAWRVWISGTASYYLESELNIYTKKISVICQFKSRQAYQNEI